MDFFETYHKLKQRLKDEGVQQKKDKAEERQHHRDRSHGKDVGYNDYPTEQNRATITILHNIYNALRGVAYRHGERVEYIYFYDKVRDDLIAEFPIVPFPERKEEITT